MPKWLLQLLSNRAAIFLLVLTVLIAMAVLLVFKNILGFI